MENSEKNALYYLTAGPQDERWGTVVTTAGCQFVAPGAPYPLSRHPERYDFTPQSGRVLGEYQMVYITRGSGYFSSASCRRQKVTAGTMLLLFPDEWHDYAPTRLPDGTSIGSVFGARPYGRCSGSRSLPLRTPSCISG